MGKSEPKITKEYYEGQGCDITNPAEEVSEGKHGIGKGFYDDVQHTSNSPTKKTISYTGI